MQLYNCKVRLSGSRDNEVQKTGMTAADIVLIEFIHGPDSVTGIYPEGEDKATKDAVLDRMLQTYPKKAVNSVFPGGSALIPERIDESRFDPLWVEKMKVENFKSKSKEENKEDALKALVG